MKFLPVSSNESRTIMSRMAFASCGPKARGHRDVVTVVGHAAFIAAGEYAIVAAALLSLIVAGQTLGAEPSASGLWQSVDDDTHEPNAWFLIRDSGGGIYTGAIVRMILKPGDDANVQCDKCVDDRRNKPWLGLEIIRGMKRDGMKYTDGTILDPRDGNIYSAQMTLTPDG